MSDIHRDATGLSGGGLIGSSRANNLRFGTQYGIVPSFGVDATGLAGGWLVGSGRAWRRVSRRDKVDIMANFCIYAR